jgi:hypothetical protein
MSVFEGYRDKDCGILLNCTAREVVKARGEALRELASALGSRPAAALLTNAPENFSAQLLPFPSENNGTHGWEEMGLPDNDGYKREALSPPDSAAGRVSRRQCTINVRFAETS